MKYKRTRVIRETPVVSDKTFAEIANKIRNAETLIFTAGAGMGVDSGLPDFRGEHGFWKAYPALRGKNLSFSQMACPDWFVKDPRMAWGFYGHRLNLYRDTSPHTGFDLLRKWAKDKRHFCYTSNVDGSYQKAGFNPDSVVECHGSIHHLQTIGRQFSSWEEWDRTPLVSDIISADPFSVVVDEDTLLAETPLPRTEDGTLLRPNILMFGDWGWDATRTDKQIDRFSDFLRETKSSKTVIVEVGAGKAIPSVRSRGHAFAQAGATLVRINPRDWDGAEYGIPLGGLEGITRIDAMM